MMPTSIRARMTLGFAAFISLLMLVVCGTFFAYTKHSDLQNADARLNEAAQEVRQGLHSSENNLTDAAGWVREEAEDLRPANVAIVVVNARGQVVAQSQRDVPSWPLRGDEWRTSTLQAGLDTIVIGVKWRETEEALRQRTTFLLVLSTFVVASSSVGAWVLVGRTLSPIDRLTRQAQEATTDLRVQLAAPSSDAEMTRLVSTLNDLLARLSETIATRERFYAAASHELRTPLQALTGHLEVALSRPRNAQEYEITLRESHAQAERLSALVQDLLLLNQLDADTSRPPKMSLDIAEICASELAALRVLAQERALQIEVSDLEVCEVFAPWNHATMLLRNIVENAIKYATHGGKVRVELTDRVLTVWNQCASIEGWDEDKTFEPFFRPDASRNSETGGNGLGLAICKAICQSNNWHITLQQEADGVRVSIDFGRSE